MEKEVTIVVNEAGMLFVKTKSGNVYPLISFDKGGVYADDYFEIADDDIEN